MRTLFSAFVLLLFGFSAQARSGHDHPGTTDLKFADGAIHAHVTWAVGPQTPAESVLRIEWKNGVDHSSAEPPGKFKVTLWMPDMGHGSSPTKNQQVLDESGQPLVGVYDVSNIYFLMGGKWEIQFTLTLADGSAETQTIELDVEGDHHH